MEVLCRKSPPVLLFTLANTLQSQLCPFKDYYPRVLGLFFMFTEIYINRYESNYKTTVSYLLPL